MERRAAGDLMELWGGLECTINRVDDRYFSQLDNRAYSLDLDDLERFAALGIRAIRYPVLWERVAPNGLDHADWRWPDAHLQRLRDLGIQPIVGLVHHGSGPRDTSLNDPGFPAKLARFAGEVARRYPWVDQYTPVNEPLTTARFSGLYGLWYPHGRDEVTFKNVLFNQCRGVVLAMRAIQQINPRALLVQTDDLGTTYATPALQYQADFNNDLRWLGWDLLCGRVDTSHPLWNWLRECCKATTQEIDWFAANTRPPDLIGINHYVTSDRFLDGDLDRYPASRHGGNGRHRYVDVEAARRLSLPIAGVAPLLTQAWERYGSPLAVTEVHIDATREDQMRWLCEVWRGAQQARGAGVDVRAVTVWGLLGLYDWNCLLTECRDYYEAGAFDVRGGRPRATAIAALMRTLADGQTPAHPVLSGSGWWQCPQRFDGTPVNGLQPGHQWCVTKSDNHAPILIIGATGTLGRAFARICHQRRLRHQLLGRAEVDIADADAVNRVLDHYQPWAVINAAGYVRVDEAEHDEERCFRENALGPETLARLCALHGVAMVTFSSDLVFDGEQDAPYMEDDPVSPLSVYGRSKARSESMVLERNPEALLVRTSAFFSPWDEHNFVTMALRALSTGNEFTAAADMTISPTFVPDLVDACLDLLIDRATGIWHLTNGDAVTWAELASRAAQLGGVDAHTLRACNEQRRLLPAQRPAYSVLGSARAFAMPPLNDALSRYLCALQPRLNCQ